MATLKSITSANSSFTLTIPGLYPAPQKLEGFAVDDMFAFDGVSTVETKMGADGKFSAGWKPTPRAVTINLQADSNSIALFEYWANAMEAAREVYACTGSVIIPGIKKSYTMSQGYLTNFSPMAGAKGTLDSQQFTITFASVKPSILG